MEDVAPEITLDAHAEDVALVGHRVLEAGTDEVEEAQASRDRSEKPEVPRRHEDIHDLLRCGGEDQVHEGQEEGRAEVNGKEPDVGAVIGEEAL